MSKVISQIYLSSLAPNSPMASRFERHRPVPTFGKRLAVFGQVLIVLGALSLLLVTPFAARLGTADGWMIGAGLLAVGGVAYLISRTLRRSERARAAGSVAKSAR